MVSKDAKKFTGFENLADKLVTSRLSDSDKERFDNLLSDWKGKEEDVISIMNYAINKGQTNEYFERLEAIFKDTLSRVLIVDRRNFNHPLSLRADRAVEDLYKRLGIEPTDT
jgi:hypothetical protein